MLEIKDSLYCEACSVYYVMAQGTQRPVGLPLKETSQIALELCSRCSGKHLGKSRRIPCRSFDEYLLRLSYCKKCTIVNKDFIKNQYYKNFIQYRCERSVFGWAASALVYLALYLLHGVALAHPLMVLAVERRRRGLSILKCVLLALLAAQMHGYEVFRGACAAYCVYRTLFSKTVYFNMPADLTSHLDLHSLLCRLNIGSLGGAPATRPSSDHAKPHPANHI